MTGLSAHVPEEVRRQFLYDENGQLKKHLKSIEQGAASTVWAATAKELESKGGKYLENCDVAKPNDGSPAGGYGEWCYDAEAAQRLYDETLQWIGLSNEGK